MSLDAILHQPWIIPEVVGDVFENLMDRDLQDLPFAIAHHPTVAVDVEHVRGDHPVEGL